MTFHEAAPVLASPLETGSELRRLDDKMMAPMARSLPAGPIKQVINRSQLERDRAGAILPRSDWGRSSLSGTRSNREEQARRLALQCREDAIKTGISSEDLEAAVEGNLFCNILQALDAAEFRQMYLDHLSKIL